MCHAKIFANSVCSLRLSFMITLPDTGDEYASQVLILSPQRFVIGVQSILLSLSQPERLVSARHF